MSKSNIHLITETLKIQPSFNFVHIPIIAIFLSSLSLFAIVTTTFTAYVIDDNNNAYAQNITQEGMLNSANKISIDVNSVTFAPLTDATTNQLKLLVNYQTTDPALVNTPMAGIMKVFLSDGSLLKTSSIPKGYVVGQSGVVQFATSFADPTIKNARAEIYMINTQDKVISNTISMDATLIK
jgi:hypothetical protein